MIISRLIVIDIKGLKLSKLNSVSKEGLTLKRISPSHTDFCLAFKVSMKSVVAFSFDWV